MVKRIGNDKPHIVSSFYLLTPWQMFFEFLLAGFQERDYETGKKVSTGSRTVDLLVVLI